MNSSHTVVQACCVRGVLTRRVARCLRTVHFVLGPLVTICVYRRRCAYESQRAQQTARMQNGACTARLDRGARSAYVVHDGSSASETRSVSLGSVHSWQS